MAACLSVLTLLGASSLAVVGCTAQRSGYSRIEETPGSLSANMRQSPGEIARLAQNAHYYKLMGQPELGLKEMELAHQQNPDNLQIVNLLAQNYEELGKFEAARQLYQEGLARHGSQPALANNLCFSYYREGRWQEAESCFRQALARDPQNQAARNNLGLLYCRLGRQDEARRLWQEAEGVAAADAKMSQALAALGMSDRAVYAGRSESGPPVVEATQAPGPKTAASHEPISAPAKDNTLAQAVSPKVSTPPALTPDPAEARPRQEATKVTAVGRAKGTRPSLPAKDNTLAQTVSPKVSPAKAHTPAQPASPKALEPRLATKPAAKTSGLVAGKPRKEAQEQAAVSEPAPPAVKATSAPTSGATVAPLAAPVPAAAPAPAQPLAPIKSEKQVTQKLAAQTPGPVEALPEAKILEPAGSVWPISIVEAAVLCYPKYLTCAELVCTAIEVRNGVGTRDLARNTRDRLHQEGFTVAQTGNHVNFGVTQTTIYYRPGAERVARVVARTFFPGAGLKPSKKLKKGMDVKILLGADLLKRPQLMARLVAEDK